MKKEYTNNSVYFMSDNMASDIVVGLDIGTTKVTTIVGYLNNNGKIEIIGHGKSASKGVEYGFIQNLVKVQESICTSVQLATSHARVDEIDSVYASIVARHIRTANCKHHIFRANHNALITQEELDAMKHDIENIALPPDQRIIAIIPQKYVIEDSAGGASHELLDPVGEIGTKITGFYQIITGDIQEIKKIDTCITSSNIQTKELVLKPFASSLSCLTEEEKQRGVALIDIGGGTTDMVIFQNGRPKSCKVIPCAGSVITRDIASVCNIPEDTAEELKVNHGSCVPTMSSPSRVSTFLRPHGQPPLKITDEQLAKIIYSRVHNDILRFVKAELENSGCMKMLQNGAGLVLTGGGAKLRHLVELCQFDLGLNTRIGIPGIGFADSLSNELKQPQFATVLGLLKYGINTTITNCIQSAPCSQETTSYLEHHDRGQVRHSAPWYQEMVYSMLNNYLESSKSIEHKTSSPKGAAPRSDNSTSSISPKQNKFKRLKEFCSYLLSNSHQEEVDIYAPSAVKPNTAFIVQLFIHDDSYTTDSISVQATKIDPNTQHRTTETLSIAIKKNDRITVEFTSFSDQQDCIIIDESQKTKVWVGKQTHFQFNVMVTDNFRASSFVGKLKIEVNREPVGECSFTILIQNKFNTTPTDISLVPRNSQIERQENLSKLKQQLENNLKNLLTQAEDSSNPEGDPFLFKNIETCKLCIQILESPIPANSIRRPRKVFVSSTCENFMTQFRETVRKTILELKMVPEMCDDWPQSGYHPTHVCCQKVMESDIYLGLFGGRYGYIEPSLNSSMTQMEYMTALSANKKILVFVINPLNETNEPDNIRQLQYDFIKCIERSRILSKFKNCQDLHQKAKSDLLDIISAY